MTPTPIHLITGLLGSGKTTTLKQLLNQRPKQERWGLLINEFGDIDIDEASLQSTLDSEYIDTQHVTGGCVCCSAQLGLTRGLEALLKTSPNRIFIEPTGLGHPAKIIDTINEFSRYHALTLQAIACIITPMQLTAERWQKSAVMRDLVNLADILLLNKTDLADSAAIEQAQSLVDGLYPRKQHVITTELGQVPLDTLLAPRTPAPFRLLEGLQAHQELSHLKQQDYSSHLPQSTHCQIQTTIDHHIRSYAWVGRADLIFNRVKLNALFTQYGSQLERAKGLIRTGNEWQLINWSEHQLQFADQGWRQDNRLEFIFSQESAISQEALKVFEIQLLNCINSPA